MDPLLWLGIVGAFFYCAAACLYFARTGRDLFEEWADD